MRSRFGVALAIVGVLTLVAAGPAAAQNNVEVHWETLQNGVYTDAGDYGSDFSPSLNANGIWELEPNANGTPALGYVELEDTASGTVEVHGDALEGDAYTRVWNYATGYTPAQAANGVMQIFGAVNGEPELGFIDLRNTGSGMVEVHWETYQNGVYTDAGDYASDFPESDAPDGDWELLATSSGTPVLGFILLKNSGSGTVEVHEDAENGGEYTRFGDWASHFPESEAGDGVWQLFGASNGATELGFIDLTNTTSGTVEVHWETLQNGMFADAGDYTSGYPESDAPDGTWGLFTQGSDDPPELGFVRTSWPTPVPSPPVQPVVQSQPLPVPPKRARIRAKFVLGWTWNHARTRLAAVHVTGFPRDGTVRIRCSGRGCPDTGKAAGHKRLHALFHSLEGRVFRAGDVVTITVSAPGKQSERIAVRIRDGALPRTRLL
jgi:hypothetical protein